MIPFKVVFCYLLSFYQISQINSENDELAKRPEANDKDSSYIHLVEVASMIPAEDINVDENMNANEYDCHHGGDGDALRDSVNENSNIDDYEWFSSEGFTSRNVSTSTGLVHQGPCVNLTRVNDTHDSNSSSENGDDKEASPLSVLQTTWRQRSEAISQRYFFNGLWQVAGRLVEAMEVFASCKDRCGDVHEMPCACSPICLVYDTCCPDFLDECEGIVDRLGATSRRFIERLTGNVQCSSGENFMMIDACPEGSPVRAIESHNNNTAIRAIEETYNNAPVTDTVFGVVFKSLQFFQCHQPDGKAGLKWLPLVAIESIAKNPRDVFEVTYETMNFSNVIYLQPEESPAYQCISDAISSCPEDFPDDDVKRLCERGPIVYVFVMSGKNMIELKNAACIECNLGSFYRDARFKSYNSHKIKKGLVVLRTLMEVKNGIARFEAYKSKRLTWKEMSCNFQNNKCAMTQCRGEYNSVEDYCYEKIQLYIPLVKIDNNVTGHEVKRIGERLLCLLMTIAPSLNGQITLPATSRPVGIVDSADHFILSLTMILASSEGILMMSKVFPYVGSFLVPAYFSHHFGTTRRLPYECEGNVMDGDGQTARNKTDEKAANAHSPKEKASDGKSFKESIFFHEGNRSRDVTSTSERAGMHSTLQQGIPCSDITNEKLHNYVVICTVATMFKVNQSAYSLTKDHCNGILLKCYNKATPFPLDAYPCPDQICHDIRAQVQTEMRPHDFDLTQQHGRSVSSGDGGRASSDRSNRGSLTPGRNISASDAFASEEDDSRSCQVDLQPGPRTYVVVTALSLLGHMCWGMTSFNL